VTQSDRIFFQVFSVRTVQELGGWRTLSMVQRYAHLAPERLVAAVERMVAAEPERASVESAPGVVAPSELRQNFGAEQVQQAPIAPVYRK